MIPDISNASYKANKRPTRLYKKAIALLCVCFVLAFVGFNSFALTGVYNGNSPSDYLYAPFDATDIRLGCGGSNTSSLDSFGFAVGSGLFLNNETQSVVINMDNGNVRLPLSVTSNSDTSYKTSTTTLDLGGAGYSSLHLMTLNFQDMLVSSNENIRFGIRTHNATPMKVRLSFYVDIMSSRIASRISDSNLYAQSEASLTSVYITMDATVNESTYWFSYDDIVSAIQVEIARLRSSNPDTVYDTTYRDNANRRGYVCRNVTLQKTDVSTVTERTSASGTYSISFVQVYTTPYNYTFHNIGAISDSYEHIISYSTTTLGDSLASFFAGATSFFATPIGQSWFTVGGLLVALASISVILAVIRLIK